MHRNAKLLLLLGSGLLAGCHAPRHAPDPTRRFAGYDSVRHPPSAPPLVSLTVFAIPVPGGEGPRGILNLTERGQAALVSAIAAKPDGAQPLAEALALPFAPAAGPSRVVDRSVVNRRVVISVENLSEEPGDRVSRARVRIRLPYDSDMSPVFRGWNRVENQYQNIDLGKLTSTQKSTTSAELGLTLPVGPASAAPSISSGSENSLQEEVTIRQRFASLVGTLTPKEATLIQEGYTGVDLTGNVHADFEIALPKFDELVYAFNYTATAGAPDCGKRPSLRAFVVRRPHWRDAVRAEIELDYTLRRIRNGRSTLIESDDSVTFVRGTYPLRNVLLVPQEDLSVAVFRLLYPAAAAGDPVVLKVEDRTTGGGDPLRDLKLASYEDAFRLLAWLQRCNAAIPGYPLQLNGRGLTAADVRRLQIENRPVN